MRTYVIADLHGRFDLLQMALEKIPKGNKIITLGDYIDRGPDSAEVIKTLREREGRDFVCLTGNHEDMATQVMDGRARMSWWIGNGGQATLDSYDRSNRNIYDDIKWWAQLPTHYEDTHRVYVHAGVDPQIPLDKQRRDVVLWKVYNPNTWIGHKRSGKHVVHGHQQSEKHPKTKDGRTALDTWAVGTGRLVVGVFHDDTPGGPIGYIEVKNEKVYRRDF